MFEQRHKDRLSALDTSFFLNERSVDLHAGTTLIFEGPAISRAELIEQVTTRTHLFPRIRQKIAFPPLKSGLPIWVDDCNFDIEEHVFESELPPPGSDGQLSALCGEIFSQPLKRTGPLWQLWLVRDLSDNRFAIICKLHHSLVDGISGVNLSRVLFDLDPMPEIIHREQWTPQPEPSSLKMFFDSLRQYGRQLRSLLSAVAEAARHPLEEARHLGSALMGLRAVARAQLVDRAPKTFINLKIGRKRSLEWAHFDLDQFKELKDSAGVKVNDVVLAAVAEALAKFFAHRGESTDGVKLRALVPVTVRSKSDRSIFGNLMVAARGPLPLDSKDPLQLLKDINKEMTFIKSSHELVGAHVISTLNEFLPPLLLAQTARFNYSTRLFNLIVTNLPGLQVPLYLRGRRLIDFLPITCLPQQHALAISVMTYNDKISFIFLGDSDALPDLRLLRQCSVQAVAELLACASNTEPDQLSTMRP